jgi:hypothetical protein
MTAALVVIGNLAFRDSRELGWACVSSQILCLGRERHTISEQSKSKSRFRFVDHNPNGKSKLQGDE